MVDLSLQQQTIELTQQIKSEIDHLDSADPVKTWLALELEGIGVDEHDPELSLGEANARLGALRQLALLVSQHCVRLQNPEAKDPIGEDQASFMTIESRMPLSVLEITRNLGFSIEPSLLHEPTTDHENFDPVSPTAKVVGYLRGLDKSLKITDSLSQETSGGALLQQLGLTDPLTLASMAVLFQSRYHALNAAIAETHQNVNQVIEFAAGISPRGYQWSQMSPGTIYVESDLPQLMIHKAKLIRNSLMAHACHGQGLLHCCAANVLDRESVFNSLSTLDQTKPFTIVTEGLLLYFGDDEMHQFLGNIQAVLTTFPQSTWVSDLVSQENLEELLSSSPDVANGVRQVFGLTGRTVVPSNPFKSEDCILRWLNQYGMSVESTVPLRNTTSMLSFDVPIGTEQRTRIVGNRKIWRLSASSK